METPLISIIVPCYNVEEYLPKCVDSLLGQTYRNIEIFLVDDGSPDRCGQLCDEYAAKDSRIRVIHKENGGLSDARNVAIDVAGGEYITFVDSDDYVVADFIERLYHLIIDNNAQMSIVSWASFCEGSNPVVDKRKNYDVMIMDKSRTLCEMFYQKKFDNSAWAKMYEASLFRDIRYPKGWLFEDLATTYKLILKCERVVFCDYKCYYYLFRKNSIEGSSFKPAKYESCINIINQLNNDRNLMACDAQKALNCRIVSFLFHVMIDIPESQKKFKQNLSKILSMYRCRVMLDRQARMKVRLACLLSFFRINIFGIMAKYTSLIR